MSVWSNDRNGKYMVIYLLKKIVKQKYIFYLEGEYTYCENW